MTETATRPGRQLPPPAWPTLLATVPYALLAVLAGTAVLVEGPASRAWLPDVVLCGIAALWTLWMFTLHPAWRNRTVVMAVFVAGFVGIAATLVLRNSWFGFLVVPCYSFGMTLLPWPTRLLAVAATGVVAGTAQHNGLPTEPLDLVGYLLVVGVNVAGMCAVAWLMWDNDRRRREREVALTQTREANRRLAATLTENATLHERLLEQAREAGVLDERHRMAREIHDTLAQGLAGIITQLQAAESDPDPATRDRRLRVATGLARESLTEARRSMHALRPAPLTDARLGDALVDLARRWSSRHGIEAAATTTGTVRPLAADAEAALLRAAQEALTNVARHASAGRVGVTLSYLDSEVALDVRDDGIGFDPARLTGRPADPAGGFGLTAMRQRFAALAGTVQVESEPGGGTAISARIPIGPTEENR